MNVKIEIDESEAISFIQRFWQSADLYCFGGYPGPVYRYRDLVLMINPGRESQKYAGLDVWKVKDLMNFYGRVKSGEYGKIEDDEAMHASVNDWDGLYEDLFEKRIEFLEI